MENAFQVVQNRCISLRASACLWRTFIKNKMATECALQSSIVVDHVIALVGDNPSGNTFFPTWVHIFMRQSLNVFGLEELTAHLQQEEKLARHQSLWKLVERANVKAADFT